MEPEGDDGVGQLAYPRPQRAAGTRGRGRRPYLIFLLGTVAAIAGVLAALIIASDMRDPLAVQVEETPQGPPLPSGYIGLSLETDLAPIYFGLGSATVNPIFVRLLRALDPRQAPIVRIGGNSTDSTWWPVPGLRRPGGIRYALTPRWLRIVNATATALHARLILGVNFEADNRVIAAAESRAFLRGISRSNIEGFELGDEPEIYSVFPWYRRNGVKVLGRPRTYNFNSYLANYATIASVLPGSVPQLGPHFEGAWFPNLGRYLSAFPRVRIATVHRYPLLRCGTHPDSPIYPTISNLLAARSTAGLAAGVARLVAVAHAHGVPLRIDEFNSVACRGKSGVSDTFASSLWVLDTLFALARAGVEGVNVHISDNSPYDPFVFSRSAGHWFGQVRPMYYGLLMFARAAPPGSRLLATRQSPDASLRTWATLARDGTVRVVLINDSPDHSATVAVRAPFGTTATGWLTRLVAPGLDAKAGVTLAGQTFGTRTTTGNLKGAPTVGAVAPIKRRYAVALPAASAALLTIPTR